MFSGGGELEEENGEEHHHEVGDNGEDADAESDGDDLWFEDDLASDSFKAVGTPHVDWTE